MQDTVMGTKMAPKYANIFMHQQETQLMSQSSKKLLIFTLFRQYLDCLDTQKRYLT